uniref:Uncharacterized protein n=1 Tax=Acrobeloides nanus TaxID=290746 RepID=A0A914CL61_9BILA
MEELQARRLVRQAETGRRRISRMAIRNWATTCFKDLRESDEKKQRRTLRRLNRFRHRAVNHGLHFVDPTDPAVHTQTIENKNVSLSDCYNLQRMKRQSPDYQANMDYLQYKADVDNLQTEVNLVDQNAAFQQQLDQDMYNVGSGSK